MSALPNAVIRIGVVEDDARIRDIVGEVLSSASDCECVGFSRMEIPQLLRFRGLNLM